MVKIPEKYADRKISLSMAGSGDPWDYFKPSSKITLRAFHDGYSFDEIRTMLEISEEEQLEKINLLIEANLLRKENENYFPTFLIVNEEETEKTYNHTREIGRIITNELKRNWKEIKDEYAKLSISQKYSIDDLSLTLVGSKLLDIALLEAFVKDKTLLKTAPKRPSPKRPDAQYYFYMIEGPAEYHGQYGEDSKDLPWKNWSFITFGKNIIDGKYNEPRGKLEEKCSKLLEKKELLSPEELASLLDVPIISKDDSLKWRELCNKIAKRILLKVKEKKEMILTFYNTLHASKYTHNSLGEFICWYIHLCYSWAIDFLVEEKIIKMPLEKYGALIIYMEGAQGLLVS
ncbi:MAG: hypothetical protein FK730_04545 [Asgard group archaeon]|nr:hypothetical protein [Asgard group archaeon]